MHLLAALLFAAASVGALPGDSLPPAPPPAAPPAAASILHGRWGAAGELSFTDVSGNKDLSLLTTRAELKRTGDSVVELTARAGVRYGRSEGTTAVEDYTAGLESRFLPAGRVSPFVTLTANRDDVRLIAVRLAAAAGAELNVVRDSSDRRLSIGMALLQDFERSGPDSTRTSISRTRFNLRLTGSLPLRDGVSLEHRTTFEPIASDLSDYLFTSETGVRVSLTRTLAFQTTYLYNRDTSPAEGVLFRNDRTLTVGLRISS